MPRIYYVYIIGNWNHKVLYIGVTNNLLRRLYEHKEKFIKGFSEKYNCNRLLYFEETDDVAVAIAREKQLKRWRREKKISLIKNENPAFLDLSEGWF